ncbi:hypothetical protein MARI151_60241 [Maribacter litoralis]|uniref:Uncharacterized protein n=1 Tax=Maribacter litoralis TaxID=2059726 RepID=A0A653WFE9_9FLAO|nr:hypothetical protein MARI151_60241 [Maribacter litoralis]
MTHEKYGWLIVVFFITRASVGFFIFAQYEKDPGYFSSYNFSP